MNYQCAQCSKTFPIEPDDQTFYDKLQVPAPTHCPDCRMQRRLAWRNERTLYKRTCALTNQPVISSYSPDGPVKQVYEPSAWFSDQWDALDYGRDFDFTRPFFEQFAELMYSVPHISLWNWEPDNADYNHCCYRLKNSYMNAATDKSEDAYYSYLSINDKSIVDCTAVEYSELAYECIDSDKLYRCAFDQLCRNCVEVYLSTDCIDCNYCFGCAGLRHKEYYFFNEPLEKEEWHKRVKDILGDYTKLQSALTQANNLRLHIPQRYASIFSSENSTGNYLWNSNNLKDCFDVRGSDTCKYVTYAPWGLKDSMDGYAIGAAELLYESCCGGLDTYNNQFCMWLKHGPNNSQYCVYCVNGCDHVFASVGLNKKQYCIFNKQYSQAEYERLRSKIIAHMKTTGEYGEFFPIQFSPFGYNETIAADYFPLTQEAVQQNGWPWRDNTGGTFGKETVAEISATISDITKEILACTQCKRNYQIIPQELSFYQQLGLALPRQCPNCRHLRRIQLRNPRRLWTRQCMCTQPDHHHGGRCPEQFETSYDPERKELVYCARCYQLTLD
jgi:DNA-directed RNA polymerase subunit RPC12/RpoP